MLVLDAALGVALAVGLDVAQVTNMAGLVGGSTVGLVVGVDCGRARSANMTTEGPNMFPGGRSGRAGEV